MEIKLCLFATKISRLLEAFKHIVLMVTGAPNHLSVKHPNIDYVFSAIMNFNINCSYFHCECYFAYQLSISLGMHNYHHFAVDMCQEFIIIYKNELLVIQGSQYYKVLLQDV